MLFLAVVIPSILIGTGGFSGAISLEIRGQPTQFPNSIAVRSCSEFRNCVACPREGGFELPTTILEAAEETAKEFCGVSIRETLGAELFQGSSQSSSPGG
jgi:hypothetical protein